MQGKEFRLDDVKRILLGEAPPIFLLETFLRTLITYIALLMIVRWMGKRMHAQLTITEMTVLVTIGAIVSVPMQVPDRGLLQGFIILVCTLIYQRGINTLSWKYQKIEDLTVGNGAMLVGNGVLQPEVMRKARISREIVFAILREREIHQLGQVKRLYIEACGQFSLFKEETKVAGLSVYPKADEKLLEEQKQVGQLVCSHCGNRKTNAVACNNCGAEDWTKAVE